MSTGKQLPTGVQKALENQAPWGFTENYWERDEESWPVPASILTRQYT